MCHCLDTTEMDINKPLNSVSVLKIKQQQVIKFARTAQKKSESQMGFNTWLDCGGSWVQIPSGTRIWESVFSLLWLFWYVFELKFCLFIKNLHVVERFSSSLACNKLVTMFAWYSLIRFFLGLFMDMHVSLQVDSINKFLGTQITCNHRLSSMQQSVCF